MKKNLMIVVFVLLVLLVGCSTSNVDENINSDVSLEDDTSIDDNSNKIDETNLEENKDQMMKFCKSTKQTDLFKYEYYWTADEYFEKVVTSNGGETLKIATPDTVCVFMKGSAVGGWDCSESSQALFQETKGVVEDLLDSPVDMYGLVCEYLPYDSTLFEVSSD